MIVWLLYHCLWIFPVKKKKIVFDIFEGNGGYGCNPRYIAEELLRRNDDYELIWLVNDDRKIFPKGIRKVKNTFFRRIFHLSTARVWVDNSRKEYGTAKRRGQFYIQTWHGALEFKPVGKFRGKLFPKIASLVSEYDSKMIDYVLSNSEWCTIRYPQMLLYDGAIIKTGSPRCDVFFGGQREKMYKKIRASYGIPDEAKIAIFAPTFRGGSQKGVRTVFNGEQTIDFEKLMCALKTRFNGEWYILLRLHPQLAAQFKSMPIGCMNTYMIDVSQYDDMNGLLAASDVFLTDYSSAAFDAINIPIPVFLYCDDLGDYTGERGRLMWNLNELPFSVARTNEELVQNIMRFDEISYMNNVKTFNLRHGVLEDGYASKRVVDLIEKLIQNISYEVRE